MSPNNRKQKRMRMDTIGIVPVVSLSFGFGKEPHLELTAQNSLCCWSLMQPTCSIHDPTVELNNVDSR